VLEPGQELGQVLVTAVQPRAGPLAVGQRAQEAAQVQTKGQPADQQLGPPVGLTEDLQRARERMLAL